MREHCGTVPPAGLDPQTLPHRARSINTTQLIPQLSGYMLKRFAVFTLLIFIVDACGDRSVVIPPGDHPVYPAIDGTPAWSPDDSSIVYAHAGIIQVFQGGGTQYNPDSAGLWLMKADGSNGRIFLNGNYNAASWSPDGAWLAMNHGGNIVKTNLAKDSIISLTSSDGCYDAAWSPDGRWIAFSFIIPGDTGTSGVWIMKSSGFGDSSRKISCGTAPSWFPDLTLLVGIRTRDGRVGLSRIAPFSRTMPPETLSFSFNHGVGAAKPAPDGKKLALSLLPPGGLYNIWTINVDGTGLTQLTSSGTTADFNWNSSGSKIVYIGYNWETFDPGNNGVVWVMNADGSNKKQLTYGPGN